MAVILENLQHFRPLAKQVVLQTRRRVLEGEKVPNDEKIFSIFEEHAELLIRGKAGKPIEFGHMIEIEQVAGGFITNFQVFESRPIEHQLVDGALETHKKIFGSYPIGLAADKGYWQDPEGYERWAEKVSVVSICKKGGRTEGEREREHGALFKTLQGFRAGIEGTISVLKRCFRLLRCMNKGWRNFAATVGASIFAHNLVNLARAPC
jgi:IS5 family transposase